MAPSSGAVFALLGKTLRQAGAAWQKASRAVEQVPKQIQQAAAQAEPIYIRNAPKHPIHPVANLRQSKGRWYTTHAATKSNARTFTSSAANAAPTRATRSSFPKSRVGNAVRQLPGAARAPFASTLRPNLTGGTLGRTAGGYSLGGGRVGGARYFSHTPAAQAQVVQQVSQAVRAFLIGGHKAQFDGVDARGNKRYRGVSALRKEASATLNGVPRASPGAFVDFAVNPTITALTPLGRVAGYASATSDDSYAYDYAQPAGLQSTGLLDVLSADFARALKDLALVLNDLRALAALGDLPITYQNRGELSSLRVHFPGCDAGTAEALCAELGVKRGAVGEDEAFDAFAGAEIALLFPFAPSAAASEDGGDLYERGGEAHGGRRPVYRKGEPETVLWHDMLSPSEVSLEDEDLSTRSEDGELGYDAIGRLHESNPWLSSGLSDYQSIESGHLLSEVASEVGAPLEFQGFQGLHRFMEMCEDRR